MPYDGNQIVLEFEKDGEGAVSGADLSHRYVWQPDAVDQLMADERTHLDGSGNVATDELLLPLTDHQGTVRDLARMDGSTTSVVDHIIYDGFGKVVSESNPAEGSLFKYTGRATDNATGIESHDQRLKIAGNADWMSEDPSGLAAGDTNTRRYCGNSPTNATDPSGLEIVYGIDLNSPTLTIGQKISKLVNARVEMALDPDRRLWLRRDAVYTITDARGEMTSEFHLEMWKFLYEYVKKYKDDFATSGEAQTVTINVGDVRMYTGQWYFDSDEVFDTGWWLWGSHQVSVKGTHCCPVISRRAPIG
jgi:RHS repeat-associated protein